ncbi:MAG: glycoside hydrolase family 13 protein [Lachnospiraceae bacterium]|nr:glycoside hydrolase family 13 protein [Lachnospiraceae bacterium]
MNKQAIYHIPDSRYCFPTGTHELVLRLRMAKEDRGCRVYLVSASKYEFYQERTCQELSVAYTDSSFIYYEIHLTLTDVRFAYIFQIEENGRLLYYSEDGVTETYNFKESFYNFFQMPYVNANDVMPTVEWMRGAVFYQIFVERFRMGNAKKDTSYLTMKWGEIPTPKSFAGGDLWGIIEKLDYIRSLGVTAVYLTPIFQSVSNHKYDIRDYYRVDPSFGDLETLKKLVFEANKRGMRVVLDAVFNHCSSSLKQFADVMEKGRKSEYYRWFLIEGDFPETEPCNYECFAACDYMPKLNTANRQVQDFLIDIGLYWIREADIDGWRLDVSDEVSHDFWRRFRKAIKNQKEDCVLIGENWHDAYAYLRGDQFDSIMNYSFTKACLDYFAWDRLDAKAMAERLSGNYVRNTEPVNYMMLNLLDSHDTLRFYTETGCRVNRLIAALALEMVYPGAVCLYYGTEIPMEGGYDPDSRRCFPWEESAGDINLVAQIRTLSALRKNPVIQYGTLRLSEEQGLLCVRRIYKRDEVRLFVNMTESTVEMKDTNLRLPETTAWNLYSTTNNQLEPEGYLIVEGQIKKEEMQ